MLLVRQPIRSVGSAHDASPLPVQLALGVIISLGVLLALWLLGYLGYHLGYARLMGVSALDLPAGGGLIAAASALIAVPMTIIRFGMSHPLWLMLGFVAIAVPAGSLAAVRPASPGGPRPHVLTVTFSYAGAIAAGVYALALLWWIASPARGQLLAPLPASPAKLAAWLSYLRMAAGLDVLGLIAISLWVVLVMRLTVPRWLRGLIAGICFSVLAMAFTATAVSNVTVSQATSERTVVVVFEGATSEQVLLLGAAHGHLATLREGLEGTDLLYLPEVFARATGLRFTRRVAEALDEELG